MKGAEVAARAAGVQLEPLAVQGPEDFEAALRAMRGAGGLLHAEAPLFVTHRTRLVELAAKTRLAAVYGIREFVEAGGLMSYGANVPDLYRRAATYVDKILKGAKPADLPVEQPTTFELVINLKTAKALGLTIPQTLLLRADRVIE
jgi:putative tryptophan/tyrosine transport system substrate-binding protein